MHLARIPREIECFERWDEMVCTLETQRGKRIAYALPGSGFIAAYLIVFELKPLESVDRLERTDRLKSWRRFFTRSVAILPDGIEEEEFRQLRALYGGNGPEMKRYCFFPESSAYKLRFHDDPDLRCPESAQRFPLGEMYFLGLQPATKNFIDSEQLQGGKLVRVRGAHPRVPRAIIMFARNVLGLRYVKILNNHRLKPVGWDCGLKVRIRVG